MTQKNLIAVLKYSVVNNFFIDYYFNISRFFLVRMGGENFTLIESNLFFLALNCGFVIKHFLKQLLLL